jgi:hypothetical protein
MIRVSFVTEKNFDRNEGKKIQINQRALHCDFEYFIQIFFDVIHIVIDKSTEDETKVEEVNTIEQLVSKLDNCRLHIQDEIKWQNK